jgi:hypothetical protein
VVSVDRVSLGAGAGAGATRYTHLLDLDRAGWAWEWLRRNPDFIALRAVTETSNPAPGALVVEPCDAVERQLLRWGLHYG